MKHYIITSLMLAGSPLQAAPFIVCNLDNNSRVIVDLGDNTLQIDDSEWVYTQVTLGGGYFSTAYASSGYYLGIVYSDETKDAYWKITLPETGEHYGEAVCTYQDK